MLRDVEGHHKTKKALQGFYGALFQSDYLRVETICGQIITLQTALLPPTYSAKSFDKHDSITLV